MKKTKISQVKAHLERGWSITSLDAFKKYNVTRLAAIIHELRHKDGMQIIDLNASTKANYSRYKMAERV